MLAVPHLGNTHPQHDAKWPNRRVRKLAEGPASSDKEGTPYTNLMSDDNVALGKIIHAFDKSTEEIKLEAHPRAGPRASCYFNPNTVVAGIVTYGGLCPGINNVIRELVHALQHLQGYNNLGL